GKPKVKGLKAARPSESSATLSWKPVPNAVKYRVYYSPKSSLPKKCAPYCPKVITPKDLKNPSYSFSGLPNGDSFKRGTNYYAKVSAINSSGTTISRWSDSVWFTTPIGGMKASVASTTSANLSWDRVPGAVKYRIYYSTDSKMSGGCSPDCTKVVTPKSKSDPSHKVTGLKPGTKYYFKVSAINSSGKSMNTWATRLVAVTLSNNEGTVDATAVTSAGAVKFKGQGYGHGIGMSQYGAEGGARAGNTYKEILKKYYPGTKLQDKSGKIRVRIEDTKKQSLTVKAQSGTKFKWPGGKITLPDKISGKSVKARKIKRQKNANEKSVLRYKVDGDWKTFQTNGVSVWNGDAEFQRSILHLVLPNGKTRAYRWALRSAKATNSTRRSINVVSLQQYTRGVVAHEMPSSWHYEAL